MMVTTSASEAKVGRKDLATVQMRHRSGRTRVRQEHQFWQGCKQTGCCELLLGAEGGDHSPLKLNSHQTTRVYFMGSAVLEAQTARAPEKSWFVLTQSFRSFSMASNAARGVAISTSICTCH